MELEIEIPEAFVGAISGHLSRKRGIVSDTKTLVDNAIVLATVPLAELFDYSNELRFNVGWVKFAWIEFDLQQMWHWKWLRRGFDYHANADPPSC